jgi:hypothetical protein
MPTIDCFSTDCKHNTEYERRKCGECTKGRIIIGSDGQCDDYEER